MPFLCFQTIYYVMKKALIFLLTLAITSANVSAEPKTKFYDFDDLLINGEYKKPQVMYMDTQAKVRFERLLKLKKDFLQNLRDTKRDKALR